MDVSSRRFTALFVALLALAMGACGPEGARAGVGSNARHELAAGEAWARRAALAGRGGHLDDETVIALGYLERLRQGLGSPFRLADYALHDPRLGDDVRRPLAWAILDRTIAGDAYRIDPAALDCVGASGAGFHAGAGRFHLALIEGAVAEADDPRAGELAVRLAYELAAADGSVWRRAPLVVAQAAALARDRALARQDALRLLRAASQQQEDALDLLVRWRAERQFLVEAPRLVPLPLDVESDALDVAPRLAAAVRALGPRLAGAGPVAPPPEPPAAGGARPLLGAAAARRLIALSDAADPPAEAPVAVALHMHEAELLAPQGLTQEEQAERRRLATTTGEEQATAELGLALDRRGEGDAALASAALGVAAALRGYAQEEVWFPGFGGPTNRDLAERYGVAVSFDRGVPAEWRPYYRRMLEQSLQDLQRVLPAPDFRGLRVRVGRDPLGSQALALHDPQRRMIFLPPATGAGTIAHELAHDLDWQAAQRRYGVTGDYATDLASRAHDRLASSVRGLAGASLAPQAGGSLPPNHQHRPAEVFARNLEWFVAAALAREGMMNGYLSSVQDEVLTGYGSVQPPDLTGGTGRALVDILDEVAPLYPQTREWYLLAYGPGRVLSPFDLIRRVLDVPAGGDEARGGAARVAAPLGSEPAALPGGYPSLAALGYMAVERARAAGMAAIDAWVCSAPGAMYDRALEAQRRQLVALAAAARARGIAGRNAARAAGRDGWQWMQRQLYGSPWPQVTVDSSTTRVLEPLLDGARAVDTSGFAGHADDFNLAQPATRCGTTLTGTASLR